MLRNKKKNDLLTRTARTFWSVGAHETPYVRRFVRSQQDGEFGALTFLIFATTWFVFSHLKFTQLINTTEKNILESFSKFSHHTILQKQRSFAGKK